MLLDDESEEFNRTGKIVPGGIASARGAFFFCLAWRVG
jgi:hypothetical protein